MQTASIQGDFAYVGLIARRDIIWERYVSDDLLGLMQKLSTNCWQPQRGQTRTSASFYVFLFSF
jgi:hypothetical protein